MADLGGPGLGVATNCQQHLTQVPFQVVYIVTRLAVSCVYDSQPPRFRYAVNQIALAGLLLIQSQSILSLGHLIVPISTLAGFAVE